MNKILTGRSKRQTILCKLFYFNAERVFCISSYTRSLARKLGVSSKAAVVFHSGLDMKNIDIQLRRPVSAKIKQLVSSLEGKKVIISVTRLDDYKGVDSVIGVLPALIKNYPDVHYLVVGNGYDLSRLKALAKESGVDRFISFTGWQEGADKYYLYKSSDIFIMPSRVSQQGNTEGLGIVYLEAGYFQLPAIGSSIHGARDAIVDGETGLLINPSSKKQIVRALIKLLRDTRLRKRMGINAREKVVREFSWNSLMPEFVSYLE